MASKKIAGYFFIFLIFFIVAVIPVNAVALPLYAKNIIIGQDSIRILYVTQSQKQILLLHAFEKKTDKTPLKEIDTALTRLAEFEDVFTHG